MQLHIEITYLKWQRIFELQKAKDVPCGSDRHDTNDNNCFAKGKKFHICGKLGHFQRFCKSNNMKKRKLVESRQRDDSSNKKFKRDNKVDCVKDKEKVDYVFNVNNDATIDCEVGGV